MKSHARFLLVVFALTVLALAATPASARATRTTYTAREFMCYEEAPQRIWFSEGGTMLHIRRQYSESAVLSTEQMVQGTNHIVNNIDLNLATGAGHAFGTFSLSPDAYDGTWDGHFTIHFSPTSFSGNAVGRGTGELAGLRVQNAFGPLDPADPDNPCGAFSASMANGVIHSPRGE